MPRITEKDDLLHDIDGRPHGRESLFWVMPIPHHELAVLAYVFKDADSGSWGRIIGIADKVSSEPVFLDMVDGIEFEGEDLDSFTVAGLKVLQPEPLKRAVLEYRADGISFEVELEALHEPFSWHDGKDGCFEWAADDRYEQSMKTRGTIRAGGKIVEFESAGHRDHSWGPRDWRALQHWKWINATSEDHTVSLHGWMSFAFGERQINGYINRNGDVRAIESLEVSADLDDTLAHRSVSGTFIDEGGKELVLEATSVAGLPIPGGNTRMNEHACTATLDGEPAIAHIELGWPSSYAEQFS